MKNHKKRFGVLSVALCFLLATVTSMPVVAQGGIGYVYPAYQDLLDPTTITDGAEHVTVNEDGSWTVTGEFTLAVDMAYDYELVGYVLQLDAATDVACDWELLLYTTPTQYYTTYYFQEAVGPHMPAGFDDSLSLKLSSVYAWHLGNDWIDDGKTFVTCPTITYRPYGEGATTIRTLALTTDIPPYAHRLGDVDDNETVDMMDALTLYSMACGEVVLEKATPLLDMNDDDCVDMMDVLLLYIYVAGVA